MANTNFVFNPKTGTMELTNNGVATKVPEQPAPSTERGERSIKMMDKVPEMNLNVPSENEGVVKFRERSDLTILQFIDQDTNNVMGYIAGYALDINFNMEMLNSVEKIESFLEALKSAFRKKVYDIAFKGAK